MAKGIGKILASSKKSKWAVGGAALNIGLSAYGAKSDFDQAKAEGRSDFAAGVNAVGAFALGELLGFKYLGLMALKSAPAIAVKGSEALGKAQRKMDMQARQIPFQNAQFNDFNQAFTMRQAGMKAAEQSRYNLQQSLMGNEAAMLRR